MNTNMLTAISRTVCARIPTQEGEFQLCHYTNTRDHREHLALTLGDIQNAENLPVRVHSECFTGDVLGSRRCDCGEQLHQAMRLIAEAGRGVIVYLRQEGRGIGLASKLQAYNLQDVGYDTVEANLLLGHQADEREYWAAAAILADLGVHSINLLTNNPDKIEQLRTLGVTVTGRTPVVAPVHADNRDYLLTKALRMSHLLDLPAQSSGGGDSSAHGFPEPVRAELDALLQRMNDHAAAQPPHERPFVTLSFAQSLDGSIAAEPGAPTRISSPASMRLTHALRAAHDAILVGIGTVLADDPALTVRLVEGPQPQPVILDSSLRLPASARVLHHPRRPWLAAAGADPAQRVALEALGASVLELPPSAGQVDLHALLRTLRGRGIGSIMVEGGAGVISAFLRLQLVDALVLTIAPRFIGGLQAVGRPSGASLRAARDQSTPLPRLKHPAYTPLDGDLLVWGLPEWES